MPNDKKFKPRTRRRLICELEDCQRNFLASPRPGRPKKYCSSDCSRKAVSQLTSRARKAKRDAERGPLSAIASSVLAKIGSTPPFETGTRAVAMRRAGYMTVNEVAAQTGSARSTVYSWLQRRKVDGVQFHRSWYVLRSSLARYLGEAAAATIGLA